MKNPENDGKQAPAAQGEKGRVAPRGATVAPPAIRGATRAPRAPRGARTEREPERVFLITNMRDIEGGWAADMQSGALGGWWRLLSYIRILYWARAAAPLADLTRGWRASRHIRDADWTQMLKAAHKAKEIAESEGWLEIVDSDKWLKSPPSGDATKKERMRRVRAKKARVKKNGNGQAGGGTKGGAVAPRGATGEAVAPRAHTIQHNKDQLQDQEKEEGTGGTGQPEKDVQKQAPAQDTAGPPDTAGGASSKPQSAPARAPKGTGWEQILELTLLSLAFGRRPSVAQKQRLQEACREACGRGATLGMIYRRLRRPRPAAQNVFDCVRQAGLDARGALTAFREFMKVDSLTWAEIERTAFDTTAQAGIQRQAEWNALRDTWGLVLADAQPLVPEDRAAMEDAR